MSEVHLFDIDLLNKTQAWCTYCKMKATEKCLSEVPHINCVEVPWLELKLRMDEERERRLSNWRAWNKRFAGMEQDLAGYRRAIATLNSENIRLRSQVIILKERVK